MRTTIFELRAGHFATDVQDEPAWQPFEEYDGKPLDRVRVQDLVEPPGALFQLVEIGAGGSFAMHSSPDDVFLPGTLRDWHDVEEDTLLSVCLVRQSG
jgi:hypothetical protein